MEDKLKEWSEKFYNDYINLEYPEGFGFRKIEEIKALRKEAADKLIRPHTSKWFKHFMQLDISTKDVDFSGDVVRFGRKEELTQEQHDLLYKSLKDLKPWRKGPFEYFGTYVDAEWKSNLKWDRIIKAGLPDLKGKIIADIGCNNTYYMYRMLKHDPSLIVGFDPMDKYYFFHKFNQRIHKDSRLLFELLGIDEFPLFEEFFDVVFFMGILYHRRHPIDSLKALLKGMKKGGVCILESLGIPGDAPYLLIPEDRYMQAPGYWFLPTWKALENMMKRAGFKNVKVLDITPTTHEEQRKTEWIDTYSLDDFLDPVDHTKTVEGYPAPVRIMISGEK